MTTPPRKALHQYRAPRFWPTWLAIGFLRLACLLPYRTQLGLGKALGRLAHRLAAERRAITRRNLALAFPELDEAERNSLARAHFESLGASIMELALARWASDEWHASMTRIDGVEYVEKAAAEGRGIILLSAHFTALEVTGRKYDQCGPTTDIVYRAFDNDLMTEFVRSTRERYGRKTIEKSDIKQMVRSLREGRVVWYAPDQSFRGKLAELVPFFGVPAMTNTATSTLARLGKAVVLPYLPRRLPEGGYVVTIKPPLENFPCGDPVADTRQFVGILEEAIRLCPDQYYWAHRKYKNLPDPYPDYYADLDAWK